MQKLTLQKYTSGDIAKLEDFLGRYLERYPDAKLASAELYSFHPALENGENAFCVLDAQERMIGFAPLFPSLTPTREGDTGGVDFWTIILASPDAESGEAVRDLLYDRIVERAGEIQAAHHLAQVRLASDLMDSQRAEIDYLEQKGFTGFEQVYVMSRETCEPNPAIALPEGVTLRQSKLESEQERANYLQVFNAGFPENAKTLQELLYLLESPLWGKGSAITAHGPTDEIVASLLVYWDEASRCGVIDDVMVLPARRGQNLGKALVGEGLGYCRGQGIPRVRLEVKASNHPALAVYRAMGFRVTHQEILFGKIMRGRASQ